MSTAFCSPYKGEVVWSPDFGQVESKESGGLGIGDGGRGISPPLAVDSNALTASRARWSYMESDEAFRLAPSPIDTESAI